MILATFLFISPLQKTTHTQQIYTSAVVSAIVPVLKGDPESRISIINHFKKEQTEISH